MSQWPFLGLNPHDYQKLEHNTNDEKAENDHGNDPHKSRFFGFVRGFPKNRWGVASVVACICGLALTMAVAVFVTQRSAHHEEGSSPHLCGNTTAEARSAGCTWDQLMWAWYPPGCPHYANDDFLLADDWTFFSDPWGTEVTDIEWEQGLDNELQLFSKHGEHLTHCLFFFLSVGQVLRDGTPATPKLRNYDHLKHCVKMLLPVVRGHANYSLINTKTPVVSYQEYC